MLASLLGMPTKNKYVIDELIETWASIVLLHDLCIWNILENTVEILYKYRALHYSHWVKF